ncbi:MAG: hypothetical protein ACUVRV_03240 [Cyanobacteriota bacterium]
MHRILALKELGLSLEQIGLKQMELKSNYCLIIVILIFDPVDPVQVATVLGSKADFTPADIWDLGTHPARKPMGLSEVTLALIPKKS